MAKKPVMLMILDGFGLSKKVDGNAVKEAHKPNIDKIFTKYPKTTLGASGLSVGLPDGQMGNSEVGHTNIGAGRVVYQALTKITKSINDGDFFEIPEFNEAVKNVKENNSTLHLVGLLSPGGVHSHMDHLKGLLELAKKNGVEKVYVHAFLDGRDVPPSSAKEFIKEIEDYMAEVGVGKIASVSGRYYAMDRDNRWNRVELAYNAIVLGKGETAESAQAAVDQSYANKKTDEFVLPTAIVKDGKPLTTVEDNDSVIFFNFRPDRARELTRALNESDFDGFERKAHKLYFVSMTEYDETFKDVHVAFKPETIKNTLGEYVGNLGKNQLRIAETEKYAHVTFFFNGGVEEPYKNEDRALVPSPKVATYDLKPEMSAYEVTDELLKRLDSDKYDMIILNFANPDMVGHTGILEAAEKAIEAVDECVGKIVDKIIEKDGTVFITADHGNAEQMVDYDTEKPMTAHTTNPVPFVYVSNHSTELREGGVLADIAPTMLHEMGLEVPSEMTGKSLLK